MKFEDLPQILPSRVPRLHSRASNGSRKDYFEWTDARCALLRKRHSEGWSFGLIAKEIGNISRNAVIGKALRMGLTKRGKQHNGSHAYRNTKPTNPPKNLRRTTRIISASNKGTLRLVDVCEPDGLNVRDLPAAAIPIEQRKILLDLTSNDCRWPYGDPGKPDFFFCGAPKQCGSSYCSIHASVARNPSRYRNVPDEEHARRSASSLRALAKAARL